MAAVIRRFSRMLVHGAGSISLTQKRNYRRHVPDSQAEAVKERWRHLGMRFRKSMDKVVSDYAEAR